MRCCWALIERPLLRVYRWERPAVSFGYFERWEPVREKYPEREAVRRWTGGGVVLHGEDFTYSMLIPRASPASRHPPAVELPRHPQRALRGAGGNGISATAAASALAKDLRGLL